MGTIMETGKHAYVQALQALQVQPGMGMGSWTGSKTWRLETGSSRWNLLRKTGVGQAIFVSSRRRRSGEGSFYKGRPVGRSAAERKGSFEKSEIRHVQRG